LRDVTKRILVPVYRHFRNTRCPQRQDEWHLWLRHWWWTQKFLWNISPFLLGYTAVCPRRQHSSTLWLLQEYNKLKRGVTYNVYVWHI
jgi:hypothetical protein